MVASQAKGKVKLIHSSKVSRLPGLKSGRLLNVDFTAPRTAKQIFAKYRDKIWKNF